MSRRRIRRPLVQPLEARRLLTIEQGDGPTWRADIGTSPTGKFTDLQITGVDARASDGEMRLVGTAGPSLFLRRTTAVGKDLGRLIRVNVSNSPVNDQGSVDVNDAGRTVVVWRATDGITAGQQSVLARVFNADGSAATGEIVVAPPQAGRFVSEPVVGIASDGTFVVAWSQLQGPTEILLKRFKPDGTEFDVGVDRTVHLTNNVVPKARLAVSTGGNFAIAYETLIDEGDGLHHVVSLSAYENDGSSPLGSRRVSDTATTGEAFTPDIAPLGNDGWAVTWESAASASADDSAIQFRTFDTSEESATSILTHTGLDGRRTNPHLITNAAGDYTIGWTYCAEADATPQQAYRAFDHNLRAVSKEKIDYEGTIFDIVPVGNGRFQSISSFGSGAFVNPLVNVLDLEATAGNDKVSVVEAEASSKLRITLNGTETSHTLTAYGRLEYDLRGGNDMFDASDVALSTNVTGGLGNDTIVGGNANDAITGDANKDVIYGGYGDDYIQGGDDRDAIYGQNGDDNLVGGAGQNLIDGGDGDDRLIAGGKGVLYGGDGVDRLDGASGDDVMDGGGGADRLYGNEGNDLLLGGGSVDRIYGGDGIDTLSGGAGGTDYLFGGPGNFDVRIKPEAGDILDSIEHA